MLMPTPDGHPAIPPSAKKKGYNDISSPRFSDKIRFHVFQDAPWGSRVLVLPPPLWRPPKCDRTVFGIIFFSPSFELSYHFFQVSGLGVWIIFSRKLMDWFGGNIRSIPKTKREVIKDLSKTSSISLSYKEKNQKHAPNNRDQ